MFLLDCYALLQLHNITANCTSWISLMELKLKFGLNKPCLNIRCVCVFLLHLCSNAAWNSSCTLLGTEVPMIKTGHFCSLSLCRVKDLNSSPFSFLKAVCIVICVGIWCEQSECISFLAKRAWGDYSNISILSTVHDTLFFLIAPTSNFSGQASRYKQYQCTTF